MSRGSAHAVACCRAVAATVVPAKGRRDIKATVTCLDASLFVHACIAAGCIGIPVTEARAAATLTDRERHDCRGRVVCFSSMRCGELARFRANNVLQLHSAFMLAC